MIHLPRRASIFWTLSASLLAVLLLAVVLQWLVAVLLVEPGLQRWHQARSELVAAEFAAQVAQVLERQENESLPRLLAERQRAIEPARLYVALGEGRWVGAPGVSPGWSRRLEAARRSYERGIPLEDGPPPPRGRGGRAPRVDFEFVAHAPVPGPTGSSATVFVAAPRVRLRFLAMLPRHAALYVPVAVLLAALAGMLISHRVQRRIARLDDLATRIGQGDLAARIEGPGRDEIGHLGTRLNEMAARLEAARDAVRALEQQRSQLLADITHDLATPLTTIRGSAETLLDPRVPASEEARQRYHHNIVLAAERMERLLEDLHELSRLEARSEELTLDRLDVAALARNSVERFGPAFAQRGLELAFVSPDVPRWIEADGHRLEQVLDNLLGNALRHVPADDGREGGSSVQVSVSALDAPPGWIELAVEDDGPGIDPDDLPHVFDRFYRADRSRSTPGSGLGLAIAREIVRRHGGHIEATARAPRGVRFTVRLPAHAPA